MGLIDRLQSWIVKRFVPGTQSTRLPYVDVYKSQRTPTDNELVHAYRDTAYFCANLNVNGVVNQKLRLYVKTDAGQMQPKCPRRPLSRKAAQYLAGVETVRKNLESSDDVEEVTEHPFLELLKAPNEWHGQSDLIGNIQLYQEMTGKAYLYIESGGFGIPSGLFILPTQSVSPQFSMGDDRLIDFYWYQSTRGRLTFKPEEILAFRMPDPRDPYAGGYAPALAAFERIGVVSKYLSHTQATLDNRARPDSIISSANPEYPIGEPERKRMEKFFLSQFGGRGTGKPYISSHGLKVDPLTWSPKDMGEMADAEAGIHQIARAFDVPLALLDKDANRANADASRNQHAEMAIRPRLRRIENVFNRFLLPRYSDRLFCCFDDPVKEDIQQKTTVRTANLSSGVTTINEERAEDGWEPVDWGDEPWLPATLRQPSEERPEVAKIEAMGQGKPGGVGAKAIEAAIKSFNPDQVAEFERHRKLLLGDEAGAAIPPEPQTKAKDSPTINVDVSVPTPPAPARAKVKKIIRHGRDDEGRFYSEVIEEDVA